MPTNKELDKTANAAMEAAAEGAAKYIAKNGGHKNTDVDALLLALREHVKAALPEALDDAKEAADLGMTDIAAATFKAAMTIAGIAAAKEAGK